MKYSRYDTEDFIQDADFQQWVKNPTPALDQFWNQFIVAHPEKEESIQAARLLLQAVRQDKHTLSDEAVGAIKEAIHQQVEAAGPGKVVPLNSALPGGSARAFSWPLWAAAVAAVILVGGVLWWSIMPATVIYATGNHEINTVVLPDSSTVVLNANSRITIENDHPWQEGNDRRVALQGEAFFNVKQNPFGKPQEFIVEIGDTKVEVLGTTFNVYARHDEVQVMLQSGCVQVVNQHMAQEPLVMMPGDLTTLSTNSPSIVLQKADTAMVTSWMKEDLILHHTLLQSVARRLEDYYGVHVVINDGTLANREFSATASVSLHDLETVLKLIEKAFDVAVIREKDRILIKDN